jgi:hypothetical protein
MLYPGGESHHCPADKGDGQSNNEHRYKIHYGRQCTAPVTPPAFLPHNASTAAIPRPPRFWQRTPASVRNGRIP